MLRLGDFKEMTRVFTQADIALYKKLGGGEVIEGEVPALLINAMFSTLLGVDLPGRGTNYLKQETDYPSTAKIGDKITARVEITRIREDKKIVDLSTTCWSDKGDLIATGRALVSARDVPDAF